MVVFNR